MDTMEYYSLIKKNKIFQFTTTWMNLEGNMLSEISLILALWVVNSIGFTALVELP